jgi:hypothetical protein
MNDAPESQYAEQMLHHLANEVKRALDANDPINRAQIIAGLIQPYSGWALRWAIRDAREAGTSWPSLGHALGQEQATLYRQYQGGGPVVTIRPYHTAGTRNDDGQTPVRQAATKLVQQIQPPTVELQNSPTAALYRPVQAMADAMTTPEPEPLLRTVSHVLEVADKLASDHGYPAAATFPQEKAVWEACGTLRTIFANDRELIRAAAEVARMMRGE